MSSGYSQIPLAEEDRHWFTILLPQGKFRFCVLPQGLSISPELFDIHTAPEIRNTDNCYKNADDILAGGTTLKQLDEVMRRILGVCKDRGIKLAPSKLQVGRRLRWGGVMVESVGHREGRSDVLISPDQAKLDEFLDLERPKSKKDVQQLCGLAAQMKKFAPGMQVTYPGMQKLCAASVCFSWTADLDKELTDLKTCLKRHVKLSPVDTTKGLILVIDSAATVGTSYLLLQEKEVGNPAMGMNFISMDSSNFKRGQINMCPFEAEVAGLRYAVKKEGHYLVACPQITVVTDCKSLGTAYQKPLEEIKNRRVMKMFLDCSHVNLVFKHIPGILNSTTDYRSRHPRDSWEATGEEDTQLRMRLGVRSVNAEAADLHPVDIRLENMAARASRDQEYQQMVQYLEQGTPVEEMD